MKDPASTTTYYTQVNTQGGNYEPKSGASSAYRSNNFSKITHFLFKYNVFIGVL